MAIELRDVYFRDERPLIEIPFAFPEVSIPEREKDIITYAYSIPKKEPDRVTVFVELHASLPMYTIFYVIDDKLYHSSDLECVENKREYLEKLEIHIENLKRVFDVHEMDVPPGLIIVYERKTGVCDAQKTKDPNNWALDQAELMEALKKRYNYQGQHETPLLELTEKMKKWGKYQGLNTNVKQSNAAQTGGSVLLKVYRFLILPIYLIVCVAYLLKFKELSAAGPYQPDKAIVVLSYLTAFVSIAMVIYLIARIESGSPNNFNITMAMLIVTPLLISLGRLFIVTSTGTEVVSTVSDMISDIASVYALAFAAVSLPQIIYLKKNELMFYKK